MHGLKCILWGSSGHALVLAELIELLGGQICASLDLRADVPPVRQEKCYRGPSAFKNWLADNSQTSDYTGIVCIGGSHGLGRIEAVKAFLNAGLRLSPLVHPRAFVERSATLGLGSHILAGAVVSARATVGAGCIINHNATVDHESTLGDGVHIAPGATVCGLVIVGEAAFVGAGATVLPRLSIGSHAVIGAGAVVTRFVPPGAVFAGNPARQLNREPQ